MEKIVKDHLIQRRRRLESTGSSTGGVEQEEQNDVEVCVTNFAFPRSRAIVMGKNRPKQLADWDLGR